MTDPADRHELLPLIALVVLALTGPTWALRDHTVPLGDSRPAPGPVTAVDHDWAD